MQYLMLVLASFLNAHAHASCASKYGHDITQAACKTFATRSFMVNENCHYSKWECATCQNGYEIAGNHRDRYEFGGKSITAGTVSKSEYKRCGKLNTNV